MSPIAYVLIARPTIDYLVDGEEVIVVINPFLPFAGTEKPDCRDIQGNSQMHWTSIVGDEQIAIPYNTS